MITCDNAKRKQMNKEKDESGSIFRGCDWIMSLREDDI